MFQPALIHQIFTYADESSNCTHTHARTHGAESGNGIARLQRDEKITDSYVVFPFQSCCLRGPGGEKSSPSHLKVCLPRCSEPGEKEKKKKHALNAAWRGGGRRGRRVSNR